MKYILLSDFGHAEEMDDGFYVVKTRSTEGPDSGEVVMEPFSEGDLYKIRKRAPAEADSLVFTDDWRFFSSKTKTLLDYVFRD
jgi:hypothetical protein